MNLLKKAKRWFREEIWWHGNKVSGNPVEHLQQGKKVFFFSCSFPTSKNHGCHLRGKIFTTEMEDKKGGRKIIIHWLPGAKKGICSANSLHNVVQLSCLLPTPPPISLYRWYSKYLSFQGGFRTNRGERTRGDRNA